MFCVFLHLLPRDQFQVVCHGLKELFHASLAHEIVIHDEYPGGVNKYATNRRGNHYIILGKCCIIHTLPMAFAGIGSPGDNRSAKIPG